MSDNGGSWSLYHDNGKIVNRCRTSHCLINQQQDISFLHYTTQLPQLMDKRVQGCWRQSNLSIMKKSNQVTGSSYVPASHIDITKHLDSQE